MHYSWQQHHRSHLWSDDNYFTDPSHKDIFVCINGGQLTHHDTVVQIRSNCEGHGTKTIVSHCANLTDKTISPSPPLPMGEDKYAL